MCSAGQRIRLSNELGGVLSWEAESAHEGSAQLLEVLYVAGGPPTLIGLSITLSHIL
jgi:hypothetical protein